MWYAALCMVIGVCQFGYVVIVTIDEASTATSRTGTSSVPPAMWGAWMLGSVLIASPILLAVDAARNVRAMRFDPREGRG